MGKPQTAFYDSITDRGRGPRGSKGIRFLRPETPRTAQENVGLMGMLTPWREAAGSAATAASTRLGAPAGSGLLAMLQARAKEQLELGGSLNDEEIRAATQGGRAAAQARGLTRSPQGLLAEVMNRALASNQRRREREAFATGVAGMEQQQQQLDTSTLGTATQATLAPLEFMEDTRRFDVNREDSITGAENDWNWNAMSGGAAAAAARKAGQQSLLGSIGGSLLKAL